MRILLLLLLSGCVQGVPMPPRAPSFSPTLDAPITVGQPGYIGSPEERPRGTDKRVLPPTREPGIWASDGELKGSGEIETPVILGINIPVPVDDGGKPDYRFANQCAELTHETFKDPTLKTPAQRLRYEERECLAARIYDMCVGYMNRDIKNNEQALLSQGAQALVAALKKSGSTTLLVARSYLSEKCHPRTNTPVVDSLFKEVLKRW